MPFARIRITVQMDALTNLIYVLTERHDTFIACHKCSTIPNSKISYRHCIDQYRIKHLDLEISDDNSDVFKTRVPGTIIFTYIWTNHTPCVSDPMKQALDALKIPHSSIIQIGSFILIDLCHRSYYFIKLGSSICFAFRTDLASQPISYHDLICSENFKSS